VAETCLYCQESKPLTLFNREHVLPQSFGTFESNFVLVGKVCAACNQYFADNLELDLARDSAEGLERFSSRLAVRSSLKKFGRGLMRCRWQGGPSDGAIMEWRAVDGELRVFPINQIGCAPRSQGSVRWFALQDFPTASELAAMGVVPGSAHFRIIVDDGAGREDAVRLLQERGFSIDCLQESQDLACDETGHVPIRIEGSVNRVLMRAAAKIGFNYFAYCFPALASMENFAEIRRFIRYGDWPITSPVQVSTESILAGVPADGQVMVHTLTVSVDRGTNTIQAQVSLFSWLQYRIVLGENFIVAPSVVESGHVFDPFNRQIVALTRNRALARESLPLAPLPGSNGENI
jgi:hypothetical protein